VEVVMALGIITFCVMALLSLFSSGLRQAKESDDRIRAANLVTAIIGRLRAAPQADLTGEGFLPFGPLNRTNGTLFSVPASSPWYVNGDGTRAANSGAAMATKGCAVSAEGSFDATNRIATVALTVWWPARADFSNALGNVSVSTFIDTQTP